MASIQMPSIKFPSFTSIDLSDFDLSKIDLSKISLPRVDLDRIDTDALGTVARDAGYVAIGIAVLAVQKVQVQRRELAKSINGRVNANTAANGKGQIDDIMTAIEARLASIDSHVASLEDKLDHAVADLEKRLPERASAALGQAHDIAKAARRQMRGLIVTAA